ncbi:MAG: acyl carrier protein [Gemmatimonadaceae bacterium]|nr:acyl carrier protein [Gemmatimonadaceae bacterium]
MIIPTADEVMQEIQRICDAELQLARPVAPDLQLVRDLGLDSLGAMILAVGLEDRYRVRLNEQDAAALVTVADLVALVQRRCAESDDAARR